MLAAVMAMEGKSRVKTVKVVVEHGKHFITSRIRVQSLILQSRLNVPL